MVANDAAERKKWRDNLLQEEEERKVHWKAAQEKQKEERREELKQFKIALEEVINLFPSFSFPPLFIIFSHKIGPRKRKRKEKEIDEKFFCYSYSTVHFE